MKLRWTKSSLGWLSIVLSIPIGILASIVANSLTTSSPCLSVENISSTRAGETVNDVILENNGGFDLTDLKATIKLQKPATFRIAPTDLSPFATMDGSSINLKPSANFILKKGQSVTIRFVSEEVNGIDSEDDLPRSIEAKVTFPTNITGTLKNRSLFSGIGWIGVIVTILIGVILGLLGALIILSTRKGLPSQPLTNATASQTNTGKP
jgi:hypothetical protein